MYQYIFFQNLTVAYPHMYRYTKLHVSVHSMKKSDHVPVHLSQVPIHQKNCCYSEIFSFHVPVHLSQVPIHCSRIRKNLNFMYRYICLMYRYIVSEFEKEILKGKSNHFPSLPIFPHPFISLNPSNLKSLHYSPNLSNTPLILQNPSLSSSLYKTHLFPIRKFTILISPHQSLALFLTSLSKGQPFFEFLPWVSCDYHR